LSDLGVTGNGNLAFGHVVQHFTATGNDGKPVDFTFRTTDVYRKIKGQWLIVQEHNSVPVDLATGKADMQSKP
jgi:ketosteroid isomerase-like protein